MARRPLEVVHDRPVLIAQNRDSLVYCPFEDKKRDKSYRPEMIYTVSVLYI